MTNLYENAMDLNTKLQHEMEILKGANEEHRVLNGKLREENKRLNNIINEFDKWLENEIKFQEIVENAHFLKKARIKLQELKGSDKK
jgi:hypothetical protein